MKPPEPMGHSQDSLRGYLEQQDRELSVVANSTWVIACELHDRQTRKNENVNGRKHVEQVEIIEKPNFIAK